MVKKKVDVRDLVITDAFGNKVFLDNPFFPSEILEKIKRRKKK